MSEGDESFNIGSYKREKNCYANTADLGVRGWCFIYTNDIKLLEKLGPISDLAVDKFVLSLLAI